MVSNNAVIKLEREIVDDYLKIQASFLQTKKPQ